MGDIKGGLSAAGHSATFFFYRCPLAPLLLLLVRLIFSLQFEQQCGVLFGWWDMHSLTCFDEVCPEASDQASVPLFLVSIVQSFRFLHVGPDQLRHPTGVVGTSWPMTALCRQRSCCHLGIQKSIMAATGTPGSQHQQWSRPQS